MFSTQSLISFNLPSFFTPTKCHTPLAKPYARLCSFFQNASLQLEIIVLVSRNICLMVLCSKIPAVTISRMLNFYDTNISYKQGGPDIGKLDLIFPIQKFNTQDSRFLCALTFAL